MNDSSPTSTVPTFAAAVQEFQPASEALTLHLQQHQSWLPLDLIWSATPEHLETGLPSARLSRSWQLLLLSDGSNTRNLELLTGQRMQVHRIRSCEVDLEVETAPDTLERLNPPLIRRQVWLNTTTSKPALLYAASWWPQDQILKYLPDPSQPIGRNLAGSHLGLFRDLRGLYLGTSEGLTSLFQHPGPFWGRHYYLWHQDQPITLIYEVFSPGLSQYLGDPLSDLLK